MFALLGQEVSSLPVSDLAKLYPTYMATSVVWFKTGTVMCTTLPPWPHLNSQACSGQLLRSHCCCWVALLASQVVYENSTMLSTGGLHGKQSVVR
jgi:hypothetical protein